MEMILRYENPESQRKWYIEETHDAEEYYRVVMYNEFLSHVISELEKRFANNPVHKSALGLLYLLPSECVRLPDDVVIPAELAEVIRIDIPNPPMFSIEYSDSVRKWKSADRFDSFKQCSAMTYPNLHALFRVALTLSITSCQLKLIKTACRSTMGESRLSSLSLMKINRDCCNELTGSADKMKLLVAEFGKANPRRINLSSHSCLLILTVSNCCDKLYSIKLDP